MKKLFTLLLVFALIPTLTSAQNAMGVQLNANSVMPMNIIGPNGPFYEGSGRTAEGSPYLNDGDWMNGIVVKPSGHKTETVQMRYDKNRQELEVQVTRDGQQMVLLVPPENVSGFVIEEGLRKREFRNGFESDGGDINKHSLFELLYDGRTKLLKHYNTKLVKGREPEMRTGLIVDKFIEDNSYYLSTGNSKVKPVKLNKKSLLQMLPAHAGKLEKFAERNDLSFKEEDDVTRILHYYDKETS